MTASLGPSNDDSDAVRHEIRAAEIFGRGFGPMTLDERRGYQSHDLQTFCPGDLEVAGWLACEMNCSDSLRAERDSTAWSWDISRPLAEQFAETLGALAARCRAGELWVVAVLLDGVATRAGRAGALCVDDRLVDLFDESVGFRVIGLGDCIAYESDGAP